MTFLVIKGKDISEIESFVETAEDLSFESYLRRKTEGSKIKGGAKYFSKATKSPYKKA